MEKWIDLCSLISSSTIEDGKLVAYFQYHEDNPEPLYCTLTYQFRVALRAVGHKITKIKSLLTDDLECKMKEYVTTITKEESDKMTKAYNAWIVGVSEEEYISCSDTESESSSSESESECDNPS